MASSLLWFLVSANILSIASAQDTKHAPRGSLDIRDVIPSDMLQNYHDYELLHLEEREDEDTIFISKRETKTPAKKTKDCDDCAWFTPWDEGDNPVSKRGILDDYIEGDANVTTHRLEVSMQRQIVFIMRSFHRCRFDSRKQARENDKHITHICRAYSLSGVEPLSFGPYNWPTNDGMLKVRFKRGYL